MKKIRELLIALFILIIFALSLWVCPIFIHNYMEKVYWPGSPLGFFREFFNKSNFEE